MQKTDQPERKMSTANEKPKVSTNWVMEHYDDDVHAPWKPLPVPVCTENLNPNVVVMKSAMCQKQSSAQQKDQPFFFLRPSTVSRYSPGDAT